MANAKTAKELADNQAEIFDLYKKHYDKTENEREYPNSCVRIAAWQAEGTDDSIKTQTDEELHTYEDVKVIVNKKYQQTLKKYLEDHVADKSFTPLLKACVKYVEVLETLAEGVDGRRLVNIDLHSANIFVNQDPTGELVVGLADFGRCAIQEGSSIEQREKLSKFLINYDRHYNITFGFPVMPFELKLYSFIKKHRITDIYKAEEALRQFAHSLVQQEKDKYKTPFSLFSEDLIATILLKYFWKFSQMIISYRFTEPREEIEFIRLCFLNRFNSVGFLQVLLYELVYTNIYRSSKVIGPISNKLTNYILRDISFVPANDLEKLYKLYFDTLLSPHRDDLRTTPKPTPINYISSLLRGGPHAFSRNMAQVFGVVAPLVIIEDYYSPAKANAASRILGSPHVKVSRPVNPRAGLPSAAAAVLSGEYKPVAPVPAVAAPTPPHLTRYAIKKNPALVAKLFNPFNAAAARNASRKATENIIKGTKTGPTRWLFRKKTRKQRH